jgi:hypothetical protein
MILKMAQMRRRHTEWWWGNPEGSEGYAISGIFFHHYSLPAPRSRSKIPTLEYYLFMPPLTATT